MTPPTNKPAATTELLLMPDGQLLAHNITPTMAALLAELNPFDEPMRERARASGQPAQLRKETNEATG